MNYTGEKLFSAAIYYYGLCSEVVNTVNIILKLDEDIDESSLRSALDKCQTKFPYLMIRAVSSRKEICLLKNDAPVVIRKTLDAPVLGTSDTNDHFLAFSYSGNKLIFSVFHGLVDGKGVLMFLRTLMYYYTIEKYHETPSPAGVMLVEDEISKEEYTDPILATEFDENMKSILPKEKKKPFFRIEKDSRITKSEPYRFYVRVSKESLLKYCKENDASPAVLFSLLIARAIKTLNPNVTETISGGLAQDLRPALKTPHSHYSTIGTIRLDYDQKIQNLDFERQNTAFRGKIILNNDEETVLVYLRGAKKFYEFVQKIPFLWLKKAFLKKIIKLNLGKQTFMVSYAGKADFGDCEKHIKEFYDDADVPSTNIFLAVNALNDDFYLSFRQEWKEKLYFEEFCNQMKNLGFSYEILDEGKFIVPGAKV